MTESKPLPRDATIGELYCPCSKITTQEDADRYFAMLVERNMSFGDHTLEEAERVEHANIGYFSGYYDPVVMARMQKLFRCVHPVFGGATPTIEDAFSAGVKLGKGSSA